MTMLTTYDELQTKGFVPVRLRVIEGEKPDYLGWETPKGCVIFKHVVGDQYIPHAAKTIGNQYDEDTLEEITDGKKLSKLEQLLEYLLG